jgi:hypothetical protein
LEELKFGSSVISLVELWVKQMAALLVATLVVLSVEMKVESLVSSLVEKMELY